MIEGRQHLQVGKKLQTFREGPSPIKLVRHEIEMDCLLFRTSFFLFQFVLVGEIADRSGVRKLLPDLVCRVVGHGLFERKPWR
jgi:hypothetical protein